MHPASPILLAGRFAPLRAELLKLLRGLSADDWIHLSGEAGGHWTLRKEDTGWALYQGEDRSPTAGVTLPATIAWQLFSKGFPPAAARAQAQIMGDPVLTMPLFKMVSIMA